MKETAHRKMETVRLSSKVYDALKSKIVSGELSAGTKVSQRDIASQMGVSRTPVRDAMLQLEQDGLLKSVGSGFLVVAEMPIEDMKRTYELRALLEGFAAKEVARKRNPNTIALLRRIIDDQKALLKTCRDSMEKELEFVELDSEFHRVILSDTGNPRLIQMANYLRTLSECQTVRSRALEVPGRMEKSLAEHEDILEAIETGMPEAANDHMITNLKDFCSDVVFYILSR